MSVDELADYFKRTRGSIKSRVNKLGLKPGEQKLMANKRYSRGSNLFSIDLQAIELVLEEANENLLARSEELLGAASKFEEEIASNEQAEMTAEFLKELRRQVKDVSKARLADGRPFSEAAKVENYGFPKLKTD